MAGTQLGHNFMSFTLQPAKLNFGVVTGPGGLGEQAVRQAAGRVRDRTKRNITSKGRVNTGKMRQSVDYKITQSNGHVVVAEVGIYARYATWQELGTAQAGAGYIYPRRAKALRFKAGGGHYVFAKRVKGVKPMFALTDALKSLSNQDFTVS